MTNPSRAIRNQLSLILRCQQKRQTSFSLLKYWEKHTRVSRIIQCHLCRCSLCCDLIGLDCDMNQEREHMSAFIIFTAFHYVWSIQQTSRKSCQTQRCGQVCVCVRQINAVCCRSVCNMLRSVVRGSVYGLCYKRIDSAQRLFGFYTGDYNTKPEIWIHESWNMSHRI